MRLNEQFNQLPKTKIDRRGLTKDCLSCVSARCGFIINTLRKKTSTGAVRKDDEYCALCSSAAAAVAISQLQLQLSHYSLVALQAFCFQKCDFWEGLEKNFSRLAIARHIFRPPHKLCYNSTTATSPRLSCNNHSCTSMIQSNSRHTDTDRQTDREEEEEETIRPRKTSCLIHTTHTQPHCTSQSHWLVEHLHELSNNDWQMNGWPTFLVVATTVHTWPAYLTSLLSTLFDDVIDDEVTWCGLVTSSQTNVNTWPVSTSSGSSLGHVTLCSVSDMTAPS